MREQQQKQLGDKTEKNQPLEPEPSRDATVRRVVCSFCSQRGVGTLVSGDRAYICAGCAALALEIIAENAAKESLTGASV